MDGPSDERIVWSKLVQPSYRTIDLRPLLDDESQELPESPFDVIHLVTAQDLVEVQLTVLEHPEQPAAQQQAAAAVTGVVHLPSGQMYIDPPAAPLPDRLRLSRTGAFAYAAFQEHGTQTEAALQKAMEEHEGHDPYALVAALSPFAGQERWTVHLWPADDESTW